MPLIAAEHVSSWGPVVGDIALGISVEHGKPGPTVVRLHVRNGGGAPASIGAVPYPSRLADGEDSDD